MREGIENIQSMGHFERSKSSSTTTDVSPIHWFHNCCTQNTWLLAIFMSFYMKMLV